MRRNSNDQNELLSSRKQSTDSIQNLESTEQSNLVNFDQIIEIIGGRNRYQYCILIIFLLQWFITVCFIIGPLYFLNSPDLLCPDSAHKFTQSCTEKNGGCTYSMLDPNQKKTMSTTFNLFCSQKNFRDYISSSSFLGSMFGTFIIAMLAEKFGRKQMMIISWSIATLGLIGITLSQGKYMLLIFTFITGFGIVPCNSLNLIIVNEQFDDKFRQIATTMTISSWALSQIFFTISAYFIDNWQIIYGFLLVMPAIVITICNFYVCESPQFLFVQNPKKLPEELNKIACKNRKKIGHYFTLDNLKSLFQEQGNNLEIQPTMYNYYHLFKYKSLRYITIASCIQMIVSQFVYYSTEFSLDNIGKNTYINAIIVACGELTSVIIITYIIQKLPRKKSTIIFLWSCTALCLISFLLKTNKETQSKSTQDTYKTLQIVDATLVRVCTSMSQAIAAVFVQEMYPTQTRSLGVGIQMGIGLIGSFLAPYLVTLFQNWGWPELGGVGIIILPFNFVYFLFKETKGKPLKDVIEEEQIQQQQQLTQQSYLQDQQISKNL